MCSTSRPVTNNGFCGRVMSTSARCPSRSPRTSVVLDTQSQEKMSNSGILISTDGVTRHEYRPDSTNCLSTFSTLTIPSLHTQATKLISRSELRSHFIDVTAPKGIIIVLA
ncbi:hypothetical protein OGATHE_002205 [Ogataea polymorpha]|uniref:Uncharacterized protein n=1 Tax=Ogataea polymorpha TaxID=460523 RepID=A0A9P8TBM5_9ASCO|nr:hypothetical protein OGATHE_002205 [Ogataea polymorpha]